MTIRQTSPSAIAAAGLMALAVAMGVGRFAFTPLLPMMQAEGLLDIERGSWLASANYAGYFAGALAAIFIRVRASLMIRGSLIAIGLTTIAMGVDDRFAGWLFFRGVAGIASAWVLVYGSAWTLEQLTAKGRVHLGGVVFTGVGVGIALAGVASMAWMQHGAASVWIFMGVGSLLVSALIWPLFAEQGETQALAQERPGADGFLRLVLCYGCLGFGYIVPATFLPAMARESLGDPRLFGWIWPLFGAAAAASTLAATALARSIGYRRLWAAASLVMAAGVAIPLASTGLLALLACALLVGATFMVISMAGLQEARRMAGPRARSLIAAMTCSFAAGQMAGPLVVSLVAKQGDAYFISLAMAAISLIACAIALITPTEKLP